MKLKRFDGIGTRGKRISKTNFRDGFLLFKRINHSLAKLICWIFWETTVSCYFTGAYPSHAFTGPLESRGSAPDGGERACFTCITRQAKLSSPCWRRKRGTTTSYAWTWLLVASLCPLTKRARTWQLVQELKEKPLTNTPSVWSDGLSPFTNCTILSISTVPLRGGRRWPCEANDGNLATTCSRTPQFSPRFSEAFHAAKPFFFFVSSLLKWRKLQPSPSKLAVRPEADGSDLCLENGG